MFNDFEIHFPKIQSYLNNFYEVEESTLKNYFNEWNDVSYPAKHIITGVGEIQRDMYFVLEGVQKSYQIANDKIHIVEFTYFPSFSGIPDSFITQTPSKYYLESISNSNLIKISYQKHQEMMKAYREIETLFRILTEFILFGIIERHYEQIALNMESRFIAQMKKRPELLNLVPQKDLASYLRIDPTNLSKLISKVKI